MAKKLETGRFSMKSSNQTNLTETKEQSGLNENTWDYFIQVEIQIHFRSRISKC